MHKTCRSPFLSAEQPFLQNRQGWKLFLNIRQTTLGPLHTFQGTVKVEAGRGRPRLTGLFEELDCPKHHSTCLDATLDAMDLSQVILASIDAALLADDPPE